MLLAPFVTCLELELTRVRVSVQVPAWVPSISTIGRHDILW